MAKLTKDEKIARLREDIHAAEEVRDTEGNTNGWMYELYRAKKLGNEVSGKSQIVTADVYETVEWTIPALMDIFDPSNGIPECVPVGPEDVDAADKMTELLRYQFWRQNDGESLLRRGIKDALLFRPGGVIKYAWEKDVKTEKKKYKGMSADELAMLSMQSGASVTGATETETGYDVTAEWTVTEYDGPRFYNIPQNEFLRHPNSRTIEDSPFVAHKRRVTADYLRRMEELGYYKNVEEAIEEQASSTKDAHFQEATQYAIDGLARNDEPSKDPARREYDLYECYVKLDVDGDGILENMLVCLVGGVIVRETENVYGRPPFILLKVTDDPHKFSGIPPSEMVESHQKLRSFLVRQIADNMAQSNNARKIYDPTRIHQSDLMDNRPGAAIRVKPNVDVRTALMELPTTAFNPVAFNVLAYVTELEEQTTGITKSFKAQGDQYAQTATGALAAINQASTRIRMQAKVLASGLNDLFRAMIYMNKKFLTQATFVRLRNDFLIVSPDDLEGRMDLVLNVLLSSQSRQQTIMNMQQLIATYGQLMQATGINLLDGNNLPNMMKETVKAMGYKNTESFLPLAFLKPPEVANQIIDIDRQMAAIHNQGGQAGGAGGQTIGSIASAGTGEFATSNRTGAGLPNAFVQPGAGSMVPGYGG